MKKYFMALSTAVLVNVAPYALEVVMDGSATFEMKYL